VPLYVREPGSRTASWSSARNRPHEPRRRPGRADEHVRFAAYLDELWQVAEADETALASRILTDSTRRWAVRRTAASGRRADDIHLALPTRSGRSRWPDVTRHPLLTRRLEEGSLFRAITLQLPWQPDDLLASSNRLQLKAAAESCTAAIEISSKAVAPANPQHRTDSLKRQSKR